MSSRQNSSISSSSIIVKQLEKRNRSGRKMALPNDLTGFKRQIEILFGLKQSVQALYTENDLINDVNQIFPSTTIYFSTNPPNANFALRQNAKDNFRASREISANNNTNGDINENDQSYDSEDDIPPSSFNKNTSYNNVDNSENYEQYANSSSFTKQQSKQPMNSSSSQIRKRFSSKHPTNSEKEASDISSRRQQNNSDIVSRNNNISNDEYRRRSQTRDTDQIIEEEEEVDDEPIDKNEEEDLLQSDEDDESRNEQPPGTDEQKEIVTKMLGPQFNGINIEGALSDAFSKLDSKTQNFYKHASNEESQEQRYAFQNLITYLTQYQSLIKRDDLTLCEDIINRCHSIIDRHRTVTNGCIAYNLKTIIVGPRNSGKSTLLTFLCEQFLTELSVTQTWKRNFVFIFDAAKLAASFTNFIEFYNTFVDMIFEAVKIQRPGFLPYLECICNYFKSIPQNQGKPPTIPKRFETNEDFRGTARSLDQIGIELYKCIQDPTAFMAWHTNVLLMPSLVASAFGFNQIHYIIDNAEYLDFEFIPSQPFVGSSDPIDIVEYFKYAISNSSFILSCENMDEFLSIFGPREDSVDLIRDADFVDVFGFENDEVQGRDTAFMVKFEEDPRTFKFTIEDCGGCPAFLSIWEEMCKEAESNTSDWNVDIYKYNEHQTSVKNYLEYILKYAFVVEDDADESEKIVQRPIIEIKPIKNVA